MGKHQKTLQQLCASPTPANIRWDDVVSLLKHLGYDLIKGDGSRRRFYSPRTKAVFTCHKPHPQPTLPKYVVEQLVAHLMTFGHI